MSINADVINAALYRYTVAHSGAEHPLLAELRHQTLKLPAGKMMSSPEQVTLIQLLIKLMGASQVIEIGTFTGYTTLAMAMALPVSGRVVSCDIDSNPSKVGAAYWRQAGLMPKIDLRIGAALDLLDQLLAQQPVPQFDFAYIDADKKNNQQYYEKLLELLRPGGLILIDNVLWKGAVVDDTLQDEKTASIRAFNDFVQADKRTDNMMLLLADGLTLARKI